VVCLCALKKGRGALLSLLDKRAVGGRGWASTERVSLGRTPAWSDCLGALSFPLRPDALAPQGRQCAENAMSPAYLWPHDTVKQSNCAQWLNDLHTSSTDLIYLLNLKLLARTACCHAVCGHDRSWAVDQREHSRTISGSGYSQIL